MKKIILTIFLIVNGFIFANEGNNNRLVPKNDSTKFNIENCVNQFSLLDTVKTKVGYQYWFVDKDFLDGRTLKMSAVEPHKATHEPHKHLEDEFFFVLEGTAEFSLNGKTAIGKPYSSFYCPPGSLHGIKNIGDTELKYLVIKKYILD
ncbi:MAG: cupin domain-containing protein [Ignavibacteriales bacterium]|nr:cupin domain-containing protein [Ignavibacteriales bacterium]